MRITKRLIFLSSVLAVCCSGLASGGTRNPRQTPADLPPETIFDSAPSATIYVGETVTLRDMFSAGPGPATITGATLSGPNATSFSIVANTCLNTVIDAVKTCEIDVLAHATVANGMSAYIDLTSSAGPFQFLLQIDSRLHDLKITPTQIDFGNQPVFSTTSRDIVLTNPNPVAIDFAEEFPTTSDVFSVNIALCAHIPAGGSCAYPVSYTPIAIGPDTGYVQPSLNCNDTSGFLDCSTAFIGLKGTGVMTNAVNVDLSRYFNEYGVTGAPGSPSAPVQGGGLDGLGNVYRQPWNGNSTGWLHQLFVTGPSGALDAAAGQTISLPAGHFYAVAFLGGAVYGPQTDLAFVVSYTDGTATTVHQSLSDWKTPKHFANEDIAINMPTRIQSDGVTDHPGPYFLYGYLLPIDHDKTVSTLKMPPTRRAFALSMNLLSVPVPVAVDLAAYYNVKAIRRDSTSSGGSPGIDGQGNALSYDQLIVSANSGDVIYEIPSPNVPNAVTQATVALPGGKFSSLRLLGMGVNGNHAGQAFVIHYTDGTSSRVLQGFSDWRTPQFDSGRPFAGEAFALRTNHRLNFDGSPHANTYWVYEYSLPLDETKTVASVTLPGSRNVVVLAMSLVR